MDSNQTAIAFQRETAWGVPADPVNLTRLRFTKESLEHEKAIVKSAEIRDDRQQGESVEVGVNGKGGAEFELSVGDFDLFLESAFMGAFADVAGVSTLRNGAARTSYVFEKKFTGIGFVSFLGLMVDTLTLNLNAKQIVTGSMEFIGKGAAESDTSLDPGPYEPAGTGLILSASSNVANLTVGGGAFAGVKSLSLTFANNLRGNDAIGVKDYDEVGLGSFLVTGKMEAYFRTRAILQAFINHATSSLSFEVSRAAADAAVGTARGYRFTIPALKFTKGMPMVPAKDSDVMLPLEFEAQVGVIGGASVTAQIEKLTVPEPAP